MKWVVTRLLVFFLVLYLCLATRCFITPPPPPIMHHHMMADQGYGAGTREGQATLASH
jgi:hypothetical protein